MCSGLLNHPKFDFNWDQIRLIGASWATSQYSFSLFGTTEKRPYKLTEGDLSFLYSKISSLKLPFVKMGLHKQELLDVTYNVSTHSGVLTS